MRNRDAYYNGYRIEHLDDPPRVEVFAQSTFFRPLYRTNNLQQAIRWIDAYRDGAQWAIEAVAKLQSALQEGD